VDQLILEPQGRHASGLLQASEGPRQVLLRESDAANTLVGLIRNDAPPSSLRGIAAAPRS
jgi:hypothetical protein